MPLFQTKYTNEQSYISLHVIFMLQSYSMPATQQIIGLNIPTHEQNNILQ